MSDLIQKLHNPWVIVGFAGQFFFMMRFVVQWIASERSKRSVIPNAFWSFSIGGGLVLFLYALHQGDPVFTIGQGLGLFIYLRNFYLIKRATYFSGKTDPTLEACQLIDTLHSEIHKLKNIAVRPSKLDETLEHLRILIETQAL